MTDCSSYFRFGYSMSCFFCSFLVSNKKERRNTSTFNFMTDCSSYFSSGYSMSSFVVVF